MCFIPIVDKIDMLAGVGDKIEEWFCAPITNLFMTP